jgi:hypothetical protein
MVRANVTSSCQDALELRDEGWRALRTRSYFENVAVSGYRVLLGRSVMITLLTTAAFPAVGECLLGERACFPLFLGVDTLIRDGVTHVP